MAIRISCPQGHLLGIAEKYAGKRVRCPKCQTAVLVPEVLVSDAAGGHCPPAIASVARENAAIAPPPLPSTVPLPPRRDLLAPPPIRENRPVVQGYRAEPSRVHSVYWLAGGMLLLVLFQLAPAYARLNPATAPDWARWLMMLAVVQLAFAIWMASLPDWCTVRMVMFLLAGVATLYGVLLGIAVLTPATKSMPFDLDDVREKARLWCAAVLLLLMLLTYASGRIGFRWRKSYSLA